jgi:transcriptional regulator with XRE-family HTH domain
MGSVTEWPIPMNFPARLVQLRKQLGLSQQRLADLVRLHVNQVRRYEAGTAQPTLDALVSLARALHVSLDALVFEEGERGPSEEMRLQFEAVSLLPDEDRRIVKALLDGMIVKHQAKRMVGSLSS